MCGIAGRYNFTSGAPASRDVVTAMCDLLRHRGPDGHGVLIDGPVALGHRRLSIIDLSDAGREPMQTDDGRLAITYNGEVYNFRELRRELEQRGHTFHSRTDAEVVLLAYREYGPQCLGRLRGMFAFAIWDRHDRSLFIARDRLGQKPLCYLEDRDGISFASEPKAFLADPAFTPRPNLAGISHYLSYQYVPTPMSGFEGVKKLPPAHYMLVQDGEIRIERYWRLSYARKLQLTEGEARDALLEKLTDAVRMRLVSDVPLGAFLSGGIDSATVVALMAQVGASPKTFSIGFEEKDYDERAYARQVAERHATDHHEFIVRPQVMEILSRLIWHFNEPYADSSAIPTYYLAQLTRQHVTVALTGDAGDESFAGYDRYVANQMAGWLDRAPGPVTTGLRMLAASLPTSGSSKRTLARARRFLEAAGESRERRYARWMMHFHPSMKNELCTPLLRDAAGDSVDLLVDAYRDSDAPDFIDATLDVDVRQYLPDDLLVKVDIATMAHGLEARSPFLDHEVMEFAASLPSSFKLRGSMKKYILKRAVRELLPDEIIDRPKMGFGVPVEHWFRGELREMAHDVLLDSTMRARGYFRTECVERLLREHVAGTRNWHYQLWNLLMLELWHRMFIDSRPTAAPDVRLAGVVPV